MTEPLGPATGWGVLHLFCRITPALDAEGVVAAVKAASEGDTSAQGAAQAPGHQVVSFAVLGHKADVGFMAVGPDLWRLRGFQASLQGSGLELVSSYVSMTEVSEYAKGMPEQMLHARLYPQLPPEGKRAVCFYPMSKRRGEQDNWYSLPYEERNDLMREHGATGRTFSGRIVQLITGSAGLDDFEWGVTLFATDPADLKEVVYTMRFDRASARYAEFGPFFTGLIGEPDEILAALQRG